MTHLLEPGVANIFSSVMDSGMSKATCTVWRKHYLALTQFIRNWRIIISFIQIIRASISTQCFMTINYPMIQPSIWLRRSKATWPKPHRYEKLLRFCHILIRSNRSTAKDYASLRERVLIKLEKMGLTDLRRHIICEEYWTPVDIEQSCYIIPTKAQFTAWLADRLKTWVLKFRNAIKTSVICILSAAALILVAACRWWHCPGNWCGIKFWRIWRVDISE